MKTETLTTQPKILSGKPMFPPLLLPPFAPVKLLPPPHSEELDLFGDLSLRAVVITSTLADIMAHGFPHGGINE